MKGAGLCLILIGILMGVEFNFFTNIFGLIDSIPQTVSNTESNLENIKICFIAQIVLMFTAGICLLIDTTNNDSVEKIHNTVQANSLEKKLDVYEFDLLENVSWHTACQKCNELGGGWRLPTKDELNDLYINKDKIGGFKNTNYWSSSEKYENYSYFQNFNSGQQDTERKTNTYNVRPVKSIIS